MTDFVDEGIRPVLTNTDCGNCRACLDVCPAVEVDHRALMRRSGIVADLARSWGPVLEVWEGHASNATVRFRGSSGGALTALSLYCLEVEGMHGVLHVGADPADPTRNTTRLSRTAEEVVNCTGSRYSPAAVCERLRLIETAPCPCVFIGQPSEVSALRKAQALRPNLRDMTGVVLSFFCAGSPATRGTQRLLESRGVTPASVASLRYRGNGWPGMFSVVRRGEEEPVLEMSYRESWKVLQAHRPFSVHLWPDGGGSDADISCGDPWYRQPRDGESGSSLIVVRTERGCGILRKAKETGYLTIERVEPWKLSRSQENLEKKRGAVGGRIATMRLLGLPTPRFRGQHLLRSWLSIPLNEKLRSTVGTARRILTRGYYRPLRLKLDGSAMSQCAGVLPRVR